MTTSTTSSPRSSWPAGPTGSRSSTGPFLKIRELDSLREFSQRTRVLGYDGKWALTPDQVGVLNEVYSPTQEQFDKAWDILDAYRKATEDDRTGAVMFGDEMIDEASRKMATKFVTRGERAGSAPVAGLRPGSEPWRCRAPPAARYRRSGSSGLPTGRWTRLRT